MSFLSCAHLDVGFLISYLGGGAVFTLGSHFLNESPSWDRFFCWVSNLLFDSLLLFWDLAFPSENMFLTNLFSGASVSVRLLMFSLGFSLRVAGLSVGCLLSCLGVSLPVGKHFSQ